MSDMVMVFGANCLGKHDGGAARAALAHGAIYGQGFGHQGNSFAIPTCSKPTGDIGHEISFEQLKFYVDCFLLYATQHPEWRFQVTRIGCGLAGWKDEVVAPLFANAPDNCAFDTLWTTYLPNARFWGTF